VGNTLTPVPAFSQISLAGGFSVIQGSHEKAHLTATHPALSGLTDPVLSNFNQSSHNLFQVWPSDFTVLAVMLDAPISSKIYTAGDGTNGAPYILAKGKGLTPVGSSCLAISNQALDCLSTNMTYQWQFCVTNTGVDTIKYLSLLNFPPGVLPNTDIITLAAPLSPGQGTCLSVLLTNTSGLKDVCFSIGAHNANLFECCSVTNCLTFNPCCLAFSGESFVPVAGTGCYNYTFTVKNVSSSTMQYLFLVQNPAPPPACLAFSPDIITLGPLAPGASTVKTVRVCIAAGCSAPYSFRAGAADPNLNDCCSATHSIPTASGSSGGGSVFGPLETFEIALGDGVLLDGSVFDAGTDIKMLVNLNTSMVRPRRVILRESGNVIDTIEIGPTSDPSKISAIWRSVAEGVYSITAEELDTLGGTWFSEPATIYVVEDQAHHHEELLAPRLASFQCSENVFNFCINTVEGVTYLVEATESLETSASGEAKSWVVQHIIVGNNKSVTVTNDLPKAAQRFYRVRVE
jgi:hypothetical protein